MESPKTEKKPIHVTIIGAGKYGMALASVMQDNPQMDIHIKFYLRNQEKCDEFTSNRSIASVTSLIKFDSRHTATTSVSEAVKGADFIFLCIPAQTLSEFFKSNSQHFEEPSIFVNCAKGMSILEKKFISQIFAEQFPSRSHKYTVLSGPSCADEIFKKMPTVVTIAGSSPESLDK